MAVKWMSGFESGLTSLTATGTGVTQSVATDQHTSKSAYSLKLVTTSGPFTLALPSFSASASTDEILFQFAIRSDQAPITSAIVLAGVDIGAGTSFTNVVMNTDGSLSVITSAGSTSTSGTTRVGPSAGGLFPANTWKVVSVRIKPSTTTSGIIQVAVDGSLVLNNTAVISAGAAPGTTRQITMQRWCNANGNYWIDDVVIMDSTSGLGSSGLPEPLRIESALVPTGDSSVQWTRSTGTSNWSCVDEVPVSGTDFVSTSTVGQRDVYDLADRPVGNTTTIYAVQAEAWALNTDGGAPSMKLGLKSSASESQVTAGLSASAGRVVNLLELDPNGSVAWTSTSVNALQATLEAA